MNLISYPEALYILDMEELELDLLLVSDRFLSPGAPPEDDFFESYEKRRPVPLQWTLSGGEVVFLSLALEMFIGVHLQDEVATPWHRDSLARYDALLEWKASEHARFAELVASCAR